ncbi:sulfatase [Pontibacter sp. G13]|uniref:LTA synthase family protein n=1 Tax=Pontibacter sp. G13 TaxID=3074898 RepID=UPI002889AEE0|nr:sulfatase [Pontibacter sp. G13]WNJ16455.1 sulfatase [Pontibacter sp. G13]
MISSAHTDILLSGLLLAGIGVLLWKLRYPAKLGKIFLYSAQAIWTLTMLVSILYAWFWTLTGSPLNYPWLRYSDFMMSPDAQSAVMAQFSWTGLLGICIAIALYVALQFFIKKGLMELGEKYGRQRLLGVFGALWGLYLLISFGVLSIWAVPQSHQISPLIQFMASTPLFHESAPLHDWPTDPEVESQISQTHHPLQLEKPNASIKNVLFVVLESTAARYVQTYDSSFQVTPHIAQYRDQALQFDAAYTHVPSTNKALFSLLTSTYPLPNFNSVTQQSPEVELPALPAVLERQGYRTGFFTSADNRFQRIGTFLEAQKFGQIQDHRSIACSQIHESAHSTHWKYMNTIEDGCVEPAFWDWVQESPDEPFFAVCWTNQTHYPYLVTDPLDSIDTSNRLRNRYLNALRESDQMFGKLMEGLKSRSLLDETLVVVLGDHGEAFGEQGQFGHAGHILEDHIKIPLLLIHGETFQGESRSEPVGMIDIAPTVTHVLGIPSPSQWQGSSLLGPRVQPNVYFFAPFSSFLFGYRNAEFKFMVDAGYGRSFLYDVEADPREQKNLIDQYPAWRGQGMTQIASWIKYHDRHLEQILKVPENLD